MARLPATGATVCSPASDLGSLQCVLADLHDGQVFDETAAHEVYGKLARIIGTWLSEQSRLQTSLLAKTLLRIAKNLSEASILLGGRETGLHSDIEIDGASRVVKYLALDPSVDSDPTQAVHTAPSRTPTQNWLDNRHFKGCCTTAT